MSTTTFPPNGKLVTVETSPLHSSFDSWRMDQMRPEPKAVEI